jgi:hypothetical protein
MIFRIGLSFGKKFGGFLWLLLNLNLGFMVNLWVDDFDEWVVDVYNLKIVLNEDESLIGFGLG